MTTLPLALSFHPVPAWDARGVAALIPARLLLRSSSPPATQTTLAPPTWSSGALPGGRPPSSVVLLSPSGLGSGVLYRSRCRQAVALGAHSFGGTQRRMVGSSSLGHIQAYPSSPVQGAATRCWSSG
ncbi:hypothetical protein BS78_03G183200 [Paspalum vaginatum]|nr:hypothetical protein BS78_03G183200 [Paspalum vaginatum]